MGSAQWFVLACALFSSQGRLVLGLCCGWPTFGTFSHFLREVPGKMKWSLKQAEQEWRRACGRVLCWYTAALSCVSRASARLLRLTVPTVTQIKSQREVQLFDSIMWSEAIRTKALTHWAILLTHEIFNQKRQKPLPPTRKVFGLYSKVDSEIPCNFLPK